MNRRQVIATRDLYAVAPAEHLIVDGQAVWSGEYVRGDKLANEGDRLEVVSGDDGGWLVVVRHRERFPVAPGDWREPEPGQDSCLECGALSEWHGRPHMAKCQRCATLFCAVHAPHRSILPELTRPCRVCGWPQERDLHDEDSDVTIGADARDGIQAGARGTRPDHGLPGQSVEPSRTAANVASPGRGPTHEHGPDHTPRRGAQGRRLPSHRLAVADASGIRGGEPPLNCHLTKRGTSPTIPLTTTEMAEQRANALGPTGKVASSA